MPATRSDKLPPIDVGAWARVGAGIHDTDMKKKSLTMDTVYAELHAGGKITKNVGITFNLNADGLGKSANVEDLIIQFDIADPFHVWAGQLLVPVDRANAAGPFFMIPWNYPGFLTANGTTVVMAPREGPYGRNTGAVVWGDFNEGGFKYLAGAFDTGEASKGLLLSGRLNLALVGKEPGFWGNASYFGDKDVVALAVGGQYQRKGSTTKVKGVEPDDYAEFNADALAEFKTSGGGWVTGEAAYYHFAGSNETITDSMYVLAAVASPVVGVGNIQPMVRYQMGKATGSSVWNVDAFLGYLIKGPALRITAGISHVDLDHGVSGNVGQIGAQAIFF